MTYQEQSPTPEPFEQIFSALADPTRRAIFEDLRAGPQAVSALAESRHVSRPAVSQHLKVLQTAGLVDVRPKGTARLYSVRANGLAPLRSYLDEVWGDVLSAFADHITTTLENDNDRTDHQDD
ncbi:MAG: ArsR/SmtB family transcription factor [Cohaesibacteraceae bacterium]